MLILTNYFKPVIDKNPQFSGFNRGYFSYGDVTGGLDYVTYNRTISFANDTESIRVPLAVGRIPQGASGFSPMNIYHVKGFRAGLNTTVDRISSATDTSATPTIAFTVERRGPFIPLPHYNRNRIFVFGGYRDTDSTYRSNTSYIIQNTETEANTTSIPEARHVGVSLYTRDNAYSLGGYNSLGSATRSIYKYVMNTDTPSTSIAIDEIGAQGYGLSYNSFGYRAYGNIVAFNNNRKYIFSTDTVSIGSNGPESGTFLQGTSTVSISVGYCWTGYRSSMLNRLYHKLFFSTETWLNSSYTTGDINTGWISSAGGC